jgi:hypothetical protein
VEATGSSPVARTNYINAFLQNGEKLFLCADLGVGKLFFLRFSLIKAQKAEDDEFYEKKGNYNKPKKSS